MDKIIVATKNAPAAIGPYSQGLIFENLVFTSGQLPLDPETGVMPEGIAAQTRQSLQNVQSILKEAGSSMDQVLKITAFLMNMEDFPIFNEIYATFFGGEPPCRSAIQVSCIPKNALIEIEAIAYR